MTFIEGANENITYLVLGYVSGVLTSVIGFYFGGNDKEKEEKESEQIKK